MIGTAKSGRLFLLFYAMAFGASLAAPIINLRAQSLLVGRIGVIDGDTIEIHGQRVRIHGIDAPESRQECTRDGKPWRCGQTVALALSDWFGSAKVTCRQTDIDRYKRIVARCSNIGEYVGGWMVANGWRCIGRNVRAGLMPPLSRRRRTGSLAYGPARSLSLGCGGPTVVNSPLDNSLSTLTCVPLPPLAVISVRGDYSPRISQMNP